MLPVQVRHLLPADTTGIAKLFNVDSVDMSEGGEFTIMLPFHELTDKDPVIIPGTTQGQAQGRGGLPFAVTGIQMYISLHSAHLVFLNASRFKTPTYTLSHPISLTGKCKIASAARTVSKAAEAIWTCLQGWTAH
jgi:hypothetical protein